MKTRHYTDAQVAEIEKALHETKNTRLQQRYQSIYLSMQGHTDKDISKMTHLTPKTIGKYMNNYLAKGLEGLVSIKQSGRPPFISYEQGQAIYRVVRDFTPDEVGFPGRFNWTAKLVASWLKKEYGIEYQESSMLQQLHQLGLSYTRPTYTLAKADPEKQRQFQAELEQQKKNSE